MTNFLQIIRFGEYTETQKKRGMTFINALIIDAKHEYEILIRPYKKNKTLEQLGYYFAAVVPVCSAWQGLAAEDADIFLKHKCCTPRIMEVMGEVIEVRASIAKMNIAEMSEYIDACITFLGTHCQAVPPPPYKDK